MKVLILHDVPAFGAAASNAEPLTPSVHVRDVHAKDLAQLIAGANMVAIAGPIDAGTAAWAEAMDEVLARDIPVVTVALSPADVVDSQGLSGTCAVHKHPGGEVEVKCVAQQLALQRMAALLRGEVVVTDTKRRHSTRFVFDGD